MSSRTIFFKNCPTERNRGEKIVLLNVIAAKKIVLMNVIATKKNRLQSGGGCGAYTNYYSVRQKIVQKVFWNQ